MWKGACKNVKEHQMKKMVGIIVIMACMCLPFIPAIQTYLHLSYTTFLDEDVEEVMPVSNKDTNDYVLLNKHDIPIKKITKTNKKRTMVVPGGESIGIEVDMEGVVVAGFHTLDESKKTKKFPAYEAGIRKGDHIIKLNNKTVTNITDVTAILEKHQKNSIVVHIKRGKEEKKLTIPFSKKDHQLGLYIKDKTTGIGTLSFYLPETYEYGALGHIISDSDTQKPIKMKQGNLVRSSVKGIEKGNKGTPGEKQASFVRTNEPLGSITRNSPYGIYGVLHPEAIGNIQDKEALPIAFDHEIQKGSAKILTVINKEEVASFDVEILQVKGQSERATKGIILRITDEKLLKETGGIVQGMSGSPIIQNGKVIGAVTHVFVNEPTTGYGVQIEWMLDEIERNKENKQIKQEAS